MISKISKAIGEFICRPIKTAGELLPNLTKKTKTPVKHEVVVLASVEGQAWKLYQARVKSVEELTLIAS